MRGLIKVINKIGVSMNYETQVSVDPITNLNSHPTLSPSYKHINTGDIQSFVESMGYTLFKSCVTKPRKADKIGFQKHMLIFDHPSLDLKDERIQLMLVNSHDGSTSLRIMLGVYRVVCSNGLIIGKTLEERRVTHKGADFLSKVYAGISAVVGQADTIKGVLGLMKDKRLNEYESGKFFKDIAINRLGFNPDLLFTDNFRARRPDDLGDDLFRVFNVGQEVVINGGIKYNHEGKNNTTRKIKGIDSIIEQNKYVWDRALELLAA